MTFSPETQAALIADGEKLAALTGGDLVWAYEMAAQWHDRAASDSEQMLDVLRKGSPEHKAAADSARHHCGSAAGLRMAAGLI